MEDANLETCVRTRLLLARLSEMEKHGEGDFSLRRVAKEAQVSCAAPYRHFRDKEELIDGIFSYVLERWDLLCHEIDTAFSADPARHLCELSLAYLRFWLSNPNYRSVLLSRTATRRREAFDAPLCRAADAYAASLGRGAEERARLTFAILTTVYGASLLAPDDEKKRQDAVRLAKEQIESIVGR